MILLLFASAFFILVFWGVGSWISPKGSASQSLLLGFATTISFFWILHWFRPLSLEMVALFSGIGLIGGMRQIKKMKRTPILDVVPISAHRTVLVYVLFGMIFFCFLFASSFPVSWYDSLLYHLPLVKLYGYQHLIPGIALLDSRLGFISSTFLLTGVTSSVLASHFYTIVNMIYHTLFFFLAGKSTMKIFQNKFGWIDIFFVGSVAFYILLHGTSLSATLAPEVGMFTFILFAIKNLQEKKIGLALLAGTLVLTAKSSGILFFIAIAIYAVLTHRIKRSPLGILSMIVIATVIITNVISSGYALFPIYFTHLPLLTGSDVPIEETRKLGVVIYDWARFNPGLPRISSESLWFWRVFLPQIPYLILFFIIIGMMLALVQRLYQRSRTERDTLVWKMFWMFFILTAISYLFAPDTRLLWPYLVPTSALGATLFVQTIQPYLSKKNSHQALFIGVLLLLLLSAFSARPTQKYLRRSQVILPILTSFNQQEPQYHSSFYLPYSIPMPDDDRCGVASPPCIVNPKTAGRLFFDSDASSRIQRIQRNEAL